MNKPQHIIISVFIVAFLYLTLEVKAGTDAGVYVVLDPISGSTLVIGSSFPVTAQVVNYGTTTINTMQMKFNIGINNITLDEWWNGTLLAGDTLEYTFLAQFVLNDTTDGINVYCLADPPGDINPPNNDANPVYTYVSSNGLEGPESEKVKLALKYFLVLPEQKIRFALQDIENNGPAEISIIGLDGKLTSNHIPPRMNNGDEVVLDLSGLPKGLYFLVIQSQHGRLTRKVIL